MTNSSTLKSFLPFFFISGMAGLMYELSWIRESAQVFGATLPALSIVTALFFGGMALGNSRMSRKGTKYSGKLLGKIELSVAISSLISLILFAVFRKITPSIYPLFNDSEALLTLYRFVAVAVTIGVPTFFIGMTFPVMVGIAPSKEGDEGEVSGLVNGVNALGAVTGTILTGFVLIPHVGMTGAIIVGAVLNVIVGVRFLTKPTEESFVSSESSSTSAKLFPALPLFFALGFCGMGAQIVWSRFLALIINNTVYTYTITIAAVIAGIAIGSLFAGKQSTKQKDLGFLFGILVLLNLTAFITAIYLPAPIWGAINAIKSEVLRMSLIGFIMFIPSIFSGAAFPVALKMIGGGSEIRGRIAGLLSASNTFGGILGSILAGFVLLPLLGISGATTIIATILLVIIIIAFVQSKRVRAAWIFILVPVIVAVLLYRTPNQFVRDYMMKGGERIEYVHEGSLSTMVVSASPDYKVMSLDRLWQGESRKTRQIMFAHLPMLLSEKVSKVLVVGVGPGTTAQRFTMYGIDSLDLVDLEPAVFTASETYFNGKWMKQPGIRKIATDGRNYIMNTAKTYDVISMEVGQVFRPYSAGFYSEDFYRGAEQRLTENGVIGQVIPITAFSREAFFRVISSFIAVFPNSQLWYNSSEFILIGFKGKSKALNSSKVLKNLRPGMQIFEDLKFNYWGGELFNLNRRENLAAGYLCNGIDLKRMVNGAKPYRDNIPELEYVTASSQQNEPFIADILGFLSPIEQIIPRISMIDLSTIESLRRTNLNNIFSEELILLFQDSQRPEFLEKALEYNGKNVLANRLLADFYWTQQNFDAAEKCLIKVFAQDPGANDAGCKIATIRLKNENLQGAVDVLYEILEATPTDLQANILMGATMTQMGNFAVARHHVEIALKLDPTSESAIQNLQYLNTLPKAAK